MEEHQPHGLHLRRMESLKPDVAVAEAYLHEKKLTGGKVGINTSDEHFSWNFSGDPNAAFHCGLPIEPCNLNTCA